MLSGPFLARPHGKCNRGRRRTSPLCAPGRSTCRRAWRCAERAGSAPSQLARIASGLILPPPDPYQTPSPRPPSQGNSMAKTRKATRSRRQTKCAFTPQAAVPSVTLALPAAWTRRRLNPSHWTILLRLGRVFCLKHSRLTIQARCQATRVFRHRHPTHLPRFRLALSCQHLWQFDALVSFLRRCSRSRRPPRRLLC
jgi:hypothetical protein